MRLRNNIARCIYTGLTLAGMLSVAAAVDIPVVNQSFEAPAAPVGALLTSVVGTGWTGYFPSSPSTARGMVPNSYTYINTPYGDQYVYISARRSNADVLADTAGIPSFLQQQVFGGPGQSELTDLDQLTLVVSLAGVGGSVPVNFRFGLYRDPELTQVLAERVSTTASPITLSSDEFLDFDIQWTAGAYDVGKPVYIGFKAEDYTTAVLPRLGIDNVRLVTRRGKLSLILLH